MISEVTRAAEKCVVDGLFLLLFLSGEVPPEVMLPNRRMGQTLGRDTVLECVIMSSPQALYYWEKDALQTWNSVELRPFVEKNGR